MRIIRVVSLVFLWSALTVAPAFAATYTWPITLTQPVSITNYVLLPPASFTLICYVSTPNAPLPKATGGATIPVTQVAGGYSYSGPPITVQVVPPGGIVASTQPPHSGDIVSCGVHVPNSPNVIGSSSTLTLP
jgi:hypothetical protein